MPNINELLQNEPLFEWVECKNDIIVGAEGTFEKPKLKHIHLKKNNNGAYYLRASVTIKRKKYHIGCYPNTPKGEQMAVAALAEFYKTHNLEQ